MWWGSSTGKKEWVCVQVCKAHLTLYCHKYARTSNQILKFYSISLRSADPEKGSEWLWSCPGAAPPFTTVNTTVLPSLMPPLATYCDYLAKSKTNTFRGHYASVLYPYQIDMANAEAAVGPQEFALDTYVAAQGGVPTAFLQWHQSAGGKGTHIVLMHSVSRYVPCMGNPPSPWYNLFFASKGEVTCGIVGCAN